MGEEVLGVLGAALALGLLALSATAAEPPAPPVVAIEVRSDVPLASMAQLRSLITIELGRPLAAEEVRRTLGNLLATGVASRIEVLTRSRPDGVVAVVAMWPRVTVEEVTVEGDLGLDRQALEQALEQAEGQPLVEGQVLRGVYSLQDLYRQRGYLEAQVKVRVTYPDPARRSAVVTYRVDSGPRAEVGLVDLQGALDPFTSARLLEQLRLASGSTYRQRAVAEAAERLRGWLIDSGYRLAQVEGPEESYDARQHRMDLLYRVEVGPRVTVEVVGADIKELQKRDLLPFLGSEGYDEALVLQAVERLERYYQERGHYKVAVTTASESMPGQMRLRLAIEPGPLYTLEEVRFVGNELVDDSRLAELMTTSPRRFLTLGSGRVVDAVLAADLDNVRAYYALQGFLDCRVAPPRVEELDGGELAVTIAIDEGLRRRVTAVAFEGVEAFTADELEQLLAGRELLRAGGPYHPLLVDDSVRVIRARYEEAGYSGAQVSAVTEWNDARTRGAVTIQVLEGPRVSIDRVIVRGNRKTRSRVIRRALDLAPGEPVSGARLLEAQRRLYRLGAFSKVEVRLAPADPGSTTRDVVARVEEGKTRRVTYGLGYDTEDGARGLLGFSSSNVAGRGYTFGADLRLSQRDSRLRLSFDQPYVWGHAVPLTYTLFYVDEERESFNVLRRGGRVEATREFGTNHRASLIYDYRIVLAESLTAAADGGADVPPREDRSIRISSLIPNVFFDGRDDPVNPTRGGSTFAQLQYAFPFLNTTEEFVKLFVQDTRHLSLGRFGVVATSIRAGAIEPFRAAVEDPVVPEDLLSSRVSIAERFFAGGFSSHRAYRLDRLGIPGETTVGGDPVGGTGLLLANVDYRFPVVGAVGGVVFADAGNVWADWRDVDPRQAKLGVGLGVRYLSPIGPLRLEVGWKLDREPGESPYAIFLSVGNPF